MPQATSLRLNPGEEAVATSREIRRGDTEVTIDRSGTDGTLTRLSTDGTLSRYDTDGTVFRNDTEACLISRTNFTKWGGQVAAGLGDLAEAGESKLEGATAAVLENFDEDSPVSQIANYVGFGVSEESGEEDSGGGVHMKLVPGMGGRLRIDDSDAIIVLVLPKVTPAKDDQQASACSDDNGMSATDDDSTSYSDSIPSERLLGHVEQPTEQAKQIFREVDEVAERADAALVAEFKGAEHVHASAYQEGVRVQLAIAIRQSHMRITSFESIDRDVVFWKITADHETLCDYAEKFLYRTPYRASAYRIVNMEPPVACGEVMHAYGNYTRRDARYFQPFREADKARLVYQELQRMFDMQALEVQGVITCWFPACKYSEMMSLHRQWVRWRCPNLCALLPRKGDVEAIRCYFGEEISFFYRFYESYIYSLLYLAMWGFLILTLRQRMFGFGMTSRHNLNTVFGMGLIIWAIWFLLSFERLAATETVRWGMVGNKASEFQRHDYQFNKTGSLQHTLYNIFGKACTISYLIVFVTVIFIVSMSIRDPTLSSYVQTGLTFIFSFTWSKAAKWIVQRENKRTQSRYHRSLVFRLAMVKVFIFLWPLFRLAFLKPVTSKICGSGWDDLYAVIFVQSAMPVAQNFTQSSPIFMDWVQRQVIHRRRPMGILVNLLGEMGIGEPLRDPGECIRGCYPTSCEVVHMHLFAEHHHVELACRTTCYDDLRRSLLSLFATQTAFNLLFVIVPMVLVWYETRKEIAVAEKSSDSSSRDPREAYSLLQYQEKCYAHAKYEYGSWGGSYVEDFLGVVLSLAVLVNFAMLCPELAAVGIIAEVLTYRILAYRMVWVTCRPYPAGSEGIGEWATVLEAIIYIAILINSLLIIDLMRTSLDEFSATSKIVFALSWCLGLGLVKIYMKVSMSDPPRTVQQAMDYNHEFVQTLHTSRGRARPRSTASRTTPDVDDVLIGVGDN